MSKKVYSPNSSNTQFLDVSGIKFTSREVDVIASIIHNRGEKKIADLLSISPRTVSAHVHNIMLKSSQNSKDAIIDFIQKSGMSDYFKKHYQEILKRNIFEKLLLKLHQQISHLEIQYTITQKNLEKSEFQTLKEDFTKAGIIILSIKNSTQNSDLNTLYEDIKTKGYYLACACLLEKIINDKKASILFENFYIEYNSIGSHYRCNDINNKVTLSKTYSKPLILTCILIVIIFFYIRKTRVIEDPIRLQSPLDLPSKNELLDRYSLQENIKSILDKNSNIAVITGELGAGKSVLARLYMQSSNLSIMWEIDAASPESVLLSLEKFAYALPKKKSDMENLEFIQKINKTEIRKQEIISYISKKLRQYPGWLLHFNNALHVDNIADYFIHHNILNQDFWGKGNIVVTIRDNEDGLDDIFPKESIIHIGKLTKEEKIELFIKKIASKKIIEEEDFLKIIDKLPDYPFDIVLAASYIKKYNIPLSEYLKNIEQNIYLSPNVSSKFLLKLPGYSKERYNIIKTSIDRILKDNSDYKLLLTLISSISHSNIPRELLNFNQDAAYLEDFLNETRLSALIESSSMVKGTFSMHYTTQKYALEHMKHSGGFSTQINQVTEILKNYYNYNLNIKHIDSIREFLPHIKSLLLNIGETKEIKAKSELYEILHSCYFDLGLYSKAKDNLEKAIEIYSKNNEKNNIGLARLYKRSGVLYRNLGESLIAEEYFQKSLKIYKNLLGEKNLDVGELMLYMSSVYRNNGEYINALNYAKKGYAIISNLKGLDKELEILKLAQAKTYEGSALYKLNDLKKAELLLKEALVEYESYYKNNHTKTAWLKTRLAAVYRKQKQFSRAQKLLEEALAEYKKYSGENSIDYAWCNSHLGIVYAMKGDNDTAKTLFKKSITIFQNHVSDNHQYIHWVRKYIKEYSSMMDNKNITHTRLTK